MLKHGKRTIIITLAVLCLLAVGTVLSSVPDMGTVLLSASDDTGTVLSSASMRDSKTVLTASAGGTISLGGASFAGQEVANNSFPITTKPSATLQCKFFNERDFKSSVIAAGQNQNTTKQDNAAVGQNAAGTVTKSGSAAGGIVPHHLLAGKMIAEFFQALSYDNPEIVVVIAPNHRRTGVSSLHTSTQSWATAFGVLEADSGLTGMLISTLKASQNTTLMEEEHSISALVPYIKYYLPGTKIVPVLLHGNYTAEESKELGKLVAKTLSGNPRTAIIASVDFSHYLDADTADKMDEITLAAIKSQDISAISLMGNDNLDSPPSIMTLLSAMEEMGAVVPEVLAHGNSSDITGSGADYTTSYFTILFKR